MKRNPTRGWQLFQRGTALRALVVRKYDRRWYCRILRRIVKRADCVKSFDCIERLFEGSQALRRGGKIFPGCCRVLDGMLQRVPKTIGRFHRNESVFTHNLRPKL